MRTSAFERLWDLGHERNNSCCTTLFVMSSHRGAFSRFELKPPWNGPVQGSAVWKAEATCNAWMSYGGSCLTCELRFQKRKFPTAAWWLLPAGQSRTSSPRWTLRHWYRQQRERAGGALFVLTL